MDTTARGANTPHNALTAPLAVPVVGEGLGTGSLTPGSDLSVNLIVWGNVPLTSQAAGSARVGASKKGLGQLNKLDVLYGSVRVALG